MNKRIKSIICLVIMASTFSVFSAETLAAVSVNSCTARSASYELVDKSCKFTKWGTDKVTVVNNGNVNMIVHINGGYQKTIKPGQEYTYATYNNSARVQVYSQRSSYGKQKVIVKTTSGTIKNV